ncbi:hypothetical protein HMPREF1981_01431 [Bacteroides pyogenes F0041]|uniref:Uncharacterized protein n=1 Tax=Bacteroides pyogenes F0041 TaxID=1321819 RepID=U2C5J3_9BACE|nr:hypothetical protein HMPREF1981_01431 [Bacteroides pyogenes F0041]GAE21488.1 hypothetical protein JCM10003_946 [Bacteroides pyogenes JCM 10003]
MLSVFLQKKTITRYITNKWKSKTQYPSTGQSFCQKEDEETITSQIGKEQIKTKPAATQKRPGKQ